MTTGLVDSFRRDSMADTVDILASRWVQFRTKAGLVKPRTGRYQRGHLDVFSAAHGANRTLRADRRVFTKWLESIGHLSVGTRRLHVSTVRSFVRWAAAEGQIPIRALTLIPKVRTPRSVPRALNRDQAVAVIASLDTQKKRVIVGLLLWCGLRCGEVAALKVEDVNEQEATIFVVGKGGHERVVPIPAELQSIVTVWLDVRRRIPGPLVPSRHGGHYSPRTISYVVATWMRSSGVKRAAYDGRGAHALRHTCASDVLDRGANIRTVQELLGHTHLSSTSVYLRRASLEDLRTAMTGRTYE